jgi:hypothetical protein
LNPAHGELYIMWKKFVESGVKHHKPKPKQK